MKGFSLELLTAVGGLAAIGVLVLAGLRYFVRDTYDNLTKRFWGRVDARKQRKADLRSLHQELGSLIEDLTYVNKLTGEDREDGAWRVKDQHLRNLKRDMLLYHEKHVRLELTRLLLMLEDLEDQSKRDTTTEALAGLKALWEWTAEHGRR